MSFTKTDKALIDRAARHLSESAIIEKNTYGLDWTVDAECKAAKRRYDRLLRDERDLRELGRRLVVVVPAVLRVSPPPPKVQQQERRDGRDRRVEDLPLSAENLRKNRYDRRVVIL